MKIEKLEMYGKIQGLRLLLKNNGITDYDDELQSLTGMNNSRFESERSEREESHAEQSQTSSMRGLERTHSDRVSSKQAPSRPNLRSFASTRFSPAGVKKIASQSVRFSNSLKKFGSNNSLKDKDGTKEQSPRSGKGKVGWAIDITPPNNGKEMAKLEAMEEGGMITNLNGITEDGAEDEEQSKSCMQKATLPQAPDLSQTGEGLIETTNTEEDLQAQTMDVSSPNNGDQASSGDQDQDPLP